MTVVIKVLGPPGCGKTTFLLKRLRECASMVSFNKIGYFSFSKQAAYEALERAQKVIDFSGKEKLIFSTLHSFAYRLLGLHKDDVFNNKHERIFSSRMGLKRQWDNEAGIFTVQKDDRIAAIAKYAVVTGIPVEEVWKPFAYTIPWIEMQRYIDGLNQYKAAYNLLDFNDMIIKAMDVEIPEFEFLFIDECQDTSHIQWSFIKEKLLPKTKVMYLVGDDDQTIFTFAGANSKEFINFAANETILLDQSYRVPSKVQEIANRVIDKISTRIPKKWKPREELPSEKNNSVKIIHDILDLKEIMRKRGEWLIIARDNYILSSARKVLQNAGIYYAERKRMYGAHTAESWAPSISPELFNAAYTYWTYKNIGYVKTQAFITMLKYMNMSARAKEIQDYDLITSENCPPDIEEYITTTDMGQALKNVTEKELLYLWALKENNEIDENFILAPPRIKLATIHSVKGSECDNVVLYTDVSPMSYQGLVSPQRFDEEMRIIYVGLTRTRKFLWILEPKTKYNFISKLYKGIEEHKEKVFNERNKEDMKYIQDRIKRGGTP